MIRNLLLIFSALVIAFGCKNSNSMREKTAVKFTVQNTISAGGKYSTVNRDEHNKMTDRLFEIIASNLNIEKNKIMTFDLFQNDTNYIWHAANNQTGIYYRFISDKTFKNIDFNQIKTSEIKSELQILNN